NSRRAMRAIFAAHRSGTCNAGASARDHAFGQARSTMNIGFIGLGTMGGPMARNLLKKGHRLVVTDAHPAAVAQLIEAGAQAAATPRDIAASSEIVITMLPDAPDVERVA